MAKKKTKVKPNLEPKQHPVALEDEKDIDLKKRKLEDFVAEIETKSNNDITSTETQRLKLAHWYNRRYGVLNKDPQMPWPGSSNITMPLIDTEVTKGKAPLMQVYDVNPIVSFTAISTEGFNKTDASENTMQWLLTTRMRDFKKNMEIGIDNNLQNGYAWVKTVYEFKTEVVTEKVRREELSQDDIEEIAVLQAAVQEGQSLPLPGGEEVIPTKDDLEILMSNLISTRFNLNKEDEIDQQAITDIMQFILDGKDEVSIKRNFIVRDAPYASIVDPSRLFPEEGVTDIQDSERITELFVETPNEMKQKARSGYYKSSAVDEILKKREITEATPDKDKTSNAHETFSQLDRDKRIREGITTTSRKGVIENKEVYCMYDIDDDGVDERCLLIYNPESSIVLRFMEYPYEHGEWPYIQLRNEETDGRIYSSRGIPEIIDEVDDMVTQNHRNKLNAGQIGNSPTFKYRLGSNINPGNMNWIPGQFYPVMHMDDFEQVNVNIKDSSFDNEEVNLKFWVESLVGSFDATFREQKSEARTATATNAIVGLQQSSQSLKISRHQDQMKKIYYQIWSLWMQYGPNQFDLVTGNGELKKMNKNEIVGQFDLVPTGTSANTNPQLEFAKAQQRFNIIMALLQQFGPDGTQQILGDEFELDIGTAFKDMMNKDDFVASNRIVRRRSKDEIKQIQDQRIAKQQAQDKQQAEQQAIDANAPVSISALQANLKNLEKGAPNGAAQRVAL